MLSIAYIFLAGLGLSFLVFIHELGHYLVARKVGMRVEVFSIGFGKPLISWMHKGVKWQICLLFFGGYVKVAGMEEGKKPEEVKDGFYSKSPFARIQFVLAGPLVNILFAFLAFTAVFAMGGRLKSFEEFTHIIGWVDEKSQLAKDGVKPGDTIATYNDREFTGFKDLLYNSVLKSKSITITGDKVDYLQGTKEPYTYNLIPYYKEGMPKDMKTIGVLQPASILRFNGFDTETGTFSPLFHSGIEKGDRILWANGKLIFSTSELHSVVNQESAFLTIERAGEILHLNVPRVRLSELQLSEAERDEFIDWKREMGVQKPFHDLFFLTHSIDEFGMVGEPFSFIDTDLLEPIDTTLLKRGDHILAVSGESVSSGLTVFGELIEKKVLLIVQKEGAPLVMNWHNEDALFTNSVDWKELQETIKAIGVKEHKGGSIRCLKPVQPITYAAFRSKVAPSEEPLPASSHLAYLFLGATLQGEKVSYNPTPVTLLKEGAQETYRTFSALIGGDLSPKWLSGPVGMVKVMHDGWSVGFTEALFWLGLISLNLGLINLLPIPVLDGGHVCFALYEMITRRPVSPKTMEKLILPFVVLLIVFFVYVTYQDISRFFFK